MILVSAGLFFFGYPKWGGYAIEGLMLIAVVVFVARLARGGRKSISQPMAEPGETVNDLYLGATYTGPRLLAPPRGTHAELVIDDDERLQFLEALKNADARSSRDVPGERHHP